MGTIALPFAPEHFWVIALASMIVGMSKGGLPVIGMLAVPLLALFISTPLAAGLLLPLYIISDLYGLVLYRRDYSRSNLQFLLPFALIGIVIGFVIVRYVDEAYSTLLVALVGLGYLGQEAMRRNNEPRTPMRPVGAILGALTGLTSYISHSGGPPYQAYVLPQKLPKMVFAGTSTIFFAIVNLIKLPFYLAAEQIELGIGGLLWLVPFALGGVWVGYRLTRILPERLFFVLVRLALGLVSILLLVEALRALAA